MAADLTLSHKLAIADTVIYASVRKHPADLATADNLLEGLPGVTNFQKLREDP